MTKPPRRPVRNRWALLCVLIVVIGLAIAAVGYVYGAVFVGVPDQDPTPELAQREQFHTAISEGLAKTGAITALLGLIPLAILFVVRAVAQYGPPPKSS